MMRWEDIAEALISGLLVDEESLGKASALEVTLAI